jgi:hypothetical protein
MEFKISCGKAKFMNQDLTVVKPKLGIRIQEGCIE